MFSLVLLLVPHSPSLTAGSPSAGWRNDIRSFYFLSVCLVTHLHQLVKPLLSYIVEYSLPIFHSASYFVQRSKYLEYSQHETYDKALTPTQRAAGRAAER